MVCLEKRNLIFLTLERSDMCLRTATMCTLKDDSKRHKHAGFFWQILYVYSPNHTQQNSTITIHCWLITFLIDQVFYQNDKQMWLARSKVTLIRAHLRLHPPYFYLIGRRAQFGFQWISSSHTPIPRSCQIKTVRSIQNDKNRYFEVVPESQSLSLPLSLTPPVAVSPLWFSLLLDMQGQKKHLCWCAPL